jgi:RNA polymerase sigma-54 factor
MGDGAAREPRLLQQQGVQARQEQRAVPGLLQAMALLPLPQEAVEAAVQQALADNPMLERSPIAPCPGCGRRAARCDRCAPASRGSGRLLAETPFETFEAMAGCEIRSSCRAVLPVVIDHLTSRGLLDRDPAEIATLHSLSQDDVEEAVRAIKAVGPAGLAERSLTDLLAAQAREMVLAGSAAGWLVDLIQVHLPALARGDVRGVATSLGVTPDRVTEALRLIRRRLRPAVPIQREVRPARPLPPDVFVYRDSAGELSVEVADSAWFGLRVAAVPDELRGDPEASAWLALHERAARQLLHQVDARAGTLHRVAIAAVRRQQGFFARGPAGHQPLTRTEVAIGLGLHPSTVSRTVAGKTLRCPDGEIVALADLFGGGTAIRARLLQELARDARRSDAQLAAALSASGFPVARRTVAKYRSELGIRPAGHGDRLDRT